MIMRSIGSSGMGGVVARILDMGPGIGEAVGKSPERRRREARPPGRVPQTVSAAPAARTIPPGRPVKVRLDAMLMAATVGGAGSCSG